MIRNYGLTVATILALSAPVLGGGNEPETHPLTLTLTLNYAGGTFFTDSVAQNRVLPASGLTVGAFYERNVLGAPRLLRVATTAENGRVVLRLNARNDKPLQLQIKTESSNCRVGQGILLATHERTVSLRTSETRGTRASKSITFGRYASDIFTRAVSIQDYGNRTGTFARRVLNGVLPRYNKITYSFPGQLGDGSYAPLANRAVIKDLPYHRSLEVVMHETFHCFWYQARGLPLEYYPPYTHSQTSRSGNPSLAASEGWASAMALETARDMARRLRLPVPDNQKNGGIGERHPLFGRPAATWIEWGQDNEANVETTVIDLADTTRDQGEVDPRYYDEANGDGIPSGPAALKAIYAGIKASRGKPPTFLTLWDVSLRRTFGAAGAATCRANGIPVPR